MQKKQNVDFSILDEELVREWAITATIPHFKKINFGGLYRAFGKYTKEQQQDILRTFLTKSSVFASEGFEVYPVELYYETHEKGHQHAHGIIKGMTLKEMKNVNKHYNDLIGVKNDKLAYFFFKEKVDGGWVKYCKKQQPKEDLLADLYEDIEKYEREQEIKNEIHRKSEEAYNRLFVQF